MNLKTYGIAARIAGSVGGLEVALQMPGRAEEIVLPTYKIISKSKLLISNVRIRLVKKIKNRCRFEISNVLFEPQTVPKFHSPP